MALPFHTQPTTGKQVVPHPSHPCWQHGSQLPLQKVKQWEPSSQGLALELSEIQGYFFTPPLKQDVGNF